MQASRCNCLLTASHVQQKTALNFCTITANRSAVMNSEGWSKLSPSLLDEIFVAITPVHSPASDCDKVCFVVQLSLNFLQRA